jgi:hypothetical protein
LSPILPNQEAANNGVYKLWVLVKVLGAAREAGSTSEETGVILALNVVLFFREMTSFSPLNGWILTATVSLRFRKVCVSSPRTNPPGQILDG